VLLSPLPDEVEKTQSGCAGKGLSDLVELAVFAFELHSLSIHNPA
jgi:hypothetical protein